MSGESSRRSNLIDVTYQHLHALLSGRVEGTHADQIAEILRVRIEQLSNFTQPFGRPSDASKKEVESGSVELRDGVTIRVEKADQPFVFAISKRFNIDEVEALVLLRSFLYNEGLPANTGDTSSVDSLIDELIENITPFYYSERLFALRVFIPLLRDMADDAPPTTLAKHFIPQIAPDPEEFARTIVEEYVRKTGAVVPEGLNVDPRKAAVWARQNAKEQLVLLEVLFWAMWDFAPCSGSLVIQIYKTAYDGNLGSSQANSTLLLDDEGSQILQDSAALWIIIMVEVLELECVGTPGGLGIATNLASPDVFWSSPESLQEIHDLVTDHTDSQFTCAYIGWAFFLLRLVEELRSMPSIPSAYVPFFEHVNLVQDRSYSKDRAPAYVIMARAALAPEAGLFELALTLITNSPLFVTSVAWRTGSSVTDPNAVAYRSVLKGFLVAIVELVPVEMVPEFEALVEVWTALYGRSEPACVATLCEQFWGFDFRRGPRRAVLDVARVRFPIQSRPLIRLLRSLTGSGFLDTDPLSTTDHNTEGEKPPKQSERSAQRVLFYLNQLQTYTQLIPTSACSGPHALYEKLPERLISSSVSTGITFTNLKAIKLPGGSILPAKSVGRLLDGDSSDCIAVAWQHEHSGWKLLLEFLTDYVNRRKRASNSGSYQEVTFGRTVGIQPLALRLEDIGIDMDSSGDDLLVTDILDLIRGVIRDHTLLAEELLEIFEAGDPVVAHTMLEAQPPDLVQLTTMVLDDALSRATPQQRNPPCTQLITSAISVLAALLAVPKYSNRVWLYVRSTASLFGSEGSIGFTSSVLASERVIGHYTMTLALLHLVHQLFQEASSSVLSVLHESPRLQQVKEEVLMRAARFVHSEIWVEHVTWKYAQLGDRFEIGRRVSAFYTQILKHSPPDLQNAPFVDLSRSVAEALIFRATPSAINPLVMALTTSSSMLKMLYTTRRYGDARRLIYMLESHLVLMRLLLNYKQRSPASSKPCLLEQALCTRVSVNASSLDSASSKVDPVDALAAYVKDRGIGSVVPVEAVEVLFSLCSSLSSYEGSSPTIIGHLSDPEGTVSSLVRIVLHPYDDALLRNAVWNFITLAVDKEPALASLFVTGQFRNPSVKGKEKAVAEPNGSPKTISALNVACDMLEQWKDLWELNPQLLASLLRFLDVVWEHGHEHKTTISAIRQAADFFMHLASIVKEELGPVPEYKPESFVDEDGIQHSDLIEGVCAYAYRTVVKAHAVHIIALDIQMAAPSQNNTASSTKPASYTSIQDVFKSEDEIAELVAEAASGAYDPSLYDATNMVIQSYFPALSLDHLRLQEPLVAREFGDGFTFSPTLLEFRLQPYLSVLEDRTEEVLKGLSSINLNLSLAHAQTTLTESWRELLLQVVPFFRGDATVRHIFLSLASSISGDIATESRSGDMMANVHNGRLSLLLALLENAWFSINDKAEEVKHFVELVKNTRGILQSSSLPPSKSFFGQTTVPFHRPLLQVAYFCVRHARSLSRRAKTLNADQRLSVSAMLDTLLSLIIDALRLVFDNAQAALNPDLDQDMQLLVTVFEQATRLDLNSSTLLWLTRCQETDVIRASLQLFSRMDVVGLTDLTFLRSRKQPLYVPHVLVFHMALASIPSAAERLAGEGVLAAYAGNPLSNVISSGLLDTVLPELPGDRNPAHHAYCNMLAVVAGVTISLGRHGQYFLSDACGLIQLYSEQIHRAMSWTIGDSLTLPLLDEIEQSVTLFSAVAMISKASGENEAVKRTLQMLIADALLLLQQLNYALTHHNHLASLFEPITTDERVAYTADAGNATSAAAGSDMVDLVRRPFLARLVHRFFKISGAVLSALVNMSRGEDVLCKDPEEWLLDQALIIPHTKVVLGEPASLGTLLELGNSSLDVLRRLVDRPAGQALTVGSRSPDKLLDVQESAITVRRNFETAAFYAVTQLALWLTKPEFDGSMIEVETEETQMEVSEKDRRGVSRRTSMTERLRRGMTGEMAVDLQNMLNRAKPLLAKTTPIVGEKDVDLTAVLSRFVQERIIVPA